MIFENVKTNDISKIRVGFEQVDELRVFLAFLGTPDLELHEEFCQNTALEGLSEDVFDVIHDMIDIFTWEKLEDLANAIENDE